MGEFKKMIKEYNARKLAKKYWRTYEQQEYRNELAENLKWMRENGDTGRNLAKTLLEDEQKTWMYLRKGNVSIDVVEKYIESWLWIDDKRYRAYDVANHLDNIQWKYQMDAVDLILKYAGPQNVASNIDKIKKEYQLEVSEKIMERNVETMAEYINKIKGEDQMVVAEKIITSESKLWIYWLQRYHEDILYKMIWRWYWRLIVEKLEDIEGSNYGGLSHKEAALTLLRNWNWRLVMDNLENLVGFEWLNYRDIALMLIWKWYWKFVVENLNKYKWVDRKEIADLLVQNDLGYVLNYYPDRFRTEEEK